uniref:Reverse transcriptase Ty1/copia-type domain-containing protein n=1 Tax=Opuntia streptacantha TaxID=393608 RepID=A0A7C9DFN5_OPUST
MPIFSPLKTHLKAIKQILKYLKHTSNLTLWYPRGCNIDLIEYANVDYAGFLVDRKNTSGMAHFLGPCFISWATALCCHVRSRSRICSGNFLLCSTVLDTATTKGLF